MSITVLYTDFELWGNMQIKHLKFFILSLCLFSFSSSCTQPGIISLFVCEKPINNPVTSEKFLSYPEEINLDGTNYGLQPELGKSDKYIRLHMAMTSNNQIYSPLPSNYKYENIWLVRNNEVWGINNFTVLKNSSYDIQWVGNLCLENTFGKNEILENIYVIAKITDNQGKQYFVKSKGQSINPIL